MRFPGFIGPSYVSQSVNVDCQRCVNLYPEMDDLGTGKEREVASLVGTPGLALLLTLPASPVRGLYTASNGTLFAVAGAKLYSVSSLWVATELGSLNTSTGAVSIADNGLQVVVVDGSNGYVWTIGSSTFAQITDPNFLGADRVAYQDGYFIFNKPSSGEFYISGLNAITFDALDIATAEAVPDNLVSLIDSNQNVYLFGSESTEVWYNSGDAGFPFARIQGAIMSVGCAAAHSVASVAGAPTWIGQDEDGFGIVYQAQGYQAKRISNSAVEAVIRGVDPSTIGTARAWTYQQGGHQFYCLNLPGVKSTWVFDASTGYWHERTNLTYFGQDRHLVDCHAVAYTKNVVGDYSSGNVYSLDASTYTDNGTAIVRMRAAPHLSKSPNRIFHTLFSLDMETGVGIDGTGQGTDPQVILQYSDDGGHSWSTERWASIGAIGARRTRARWMRLGSARDRVYRVIISDPVKVTLIGADITVDEGAA